MARWGPHNTVTVIDPSPVNWLSITWNAMEKANRVDHAGIGQPSLAAGWKWVDDETLELLRRNAVFQDGAKYDAKLFKLAFDKVQEWTDPHPPGAFLNFAQDTTIQVVDDYTVRMRFPGGEVRVIYDNAVSKEDAIRSVASGDGKVDVVIDLTVAEARAFDGQGGGKTQAKALKILYAIS